MLNEKGKGWEHFEHQADIGIRGFGATKAEAFEQAALALTAVIVEPKEVAAEQRVRICCEAADDEILFVDWLNSLLYQMDVRRMLFSRFEVRIESGLLEAAAWGQKIDSLQQSLSVEVKGASFAMLKVGEEKKGLWVAQCVVDV